MSTKPDTGTATGDALTARLAQQDREVFWLREAWAARGAAQNPNDFKAAVRDQMWATVVADLAEHYAAAVREVSAK